MISKLLIYIGILVVFSLCGFLLGFVSASHNLSVEKLRNAQREQGKLQAEKEFYTWAKKHVGETVLNEFVTASKDGYN